MTTISISIQDDQAEVLRSLAKSAGLSPENFIRQQVEEMVTQRREKFLRVAEYLLTKNAELYRRMAQAADIPFQTTSDSTENG